MRSVPPNDLFFNFDGFFHVSIGIDDRIELLLRNRAPNFRTTF